MAIFSKKFDSNLIKNKGSSKKKSYERLNYGSVAYLKLCPEN